MRYSKQHPDLPTEKCDDCGGAGVLCAFCPDEPSCHDPRCETCPTCDGTGRVPPYSPMIGDEVKWYRSGYTIVGLGENGIAVRDDIGWHSVSDTRGLNLEDLTLIKPCLDTPERQALQEKLEK